MKAVNIIIVLSILALGLFTFKKTQINSNVISENLDEAYFAGGCFWCMESDFEHLQGVKEVISGYSGGDEKNPTYEQVSSGNTGHRESVKVIYNKNQISYNDLLEYFWTHIDPFNPDGEFCDIGFQYTSAIFYKNEYEKNLAEMSKQKVQELFNQNVSTSIIKFKSFYNAEDYHQDFYEKSPLKYKTYRFLCRRDSTVNEIWKDKFLNLTNYKKPSDKELKK